MSKRNETENNIHITPGLFWHAVNILITKPHVVNKRLWGCKLLGRYMCEAPDEEWKDLLSVKMEISENINEFQSKLSTYLKIPRTTDDKEVYDTELLFMELLPRNYGSKHAFQLVCLQKKKLAALFIDVTPYEHCQNLCPDFVYKLFLENDTIELYANVDVTSKSYKWLTSTVVLQVNKWALEVSVNSIQTVQKSLALVPNDQYYEKYNVLKERYGKELVKIWPECTDPSKFVYEDIAIATYLLLLWEDDANSTRMQKFVDMGCGNGLLVYILNMEGHIGYGIDVRKRRIWDMYPNNIKLLEKTVTPSNVFTFTDVDWVIGNHSDELTPWIPVIAARSSYECKFFLLPCCAYNFDGTKYQRQNSSKSQYTEYLEYIQSLCKTCGFETITDRLKIPSTKRICLIGKKRNHNQNEFNRYCESIDDLVKHSTSSNISNSVENIVSENFKARQATERVRNCSQVDKNIVDIIVSCITKYLLEGCKLDSDWSLGKSVDIKEVVSLLSPDMLKVLKSECGGLQTLLKNNNQIFNVRNGKIQMQYPKTVEEMQRIADNKRFKSNIKLKSKACWFYKNHPQGCPLNDVECSFLH